MRSSVPPRASVMALSFGNSSRSEEHTSELQSRFDLVCRLLLEKKKETTNEAMSVRQEMPKTRRLGKSICVVTDMIDSFIVNVMSFFLVAGAIEYRVMLASGVS